MRIEMGAYPYSISFSILVVLQLTTIHLDRTSCQISDDDNPQKWLEYAKSRIAKFKNSIYFQNRNSPKNIILFVGDGMSIQTVTATRYLKAQMVNDLAGRSQLVWDEWETSSLVQTFSADRMTSDSGAAATALFSGAKGNHDTVGLTGGARCCECYELRKDQFSRSALQYAVDAGLSTGFVTTTTVTHATPGATYAGSPHRNWESISDTGTNGSQTIYCQDIATQMIEKAINFSVIMGGGWKHFYKNPTSHTPSSMGQRKDDKNLLDQWYLHQTKENRSFAMVFDREHLLNVTPSVTDYLLGLFNAGHMEYDLERKDEPSLAEMVEVAIKIVSKNHKGYLLMVEGGRIDHGHHLNMARNALTEALAMEKAVQQAISQVDLNNTMIIVTADHAHAFGLVGYASRDRDIFDTVDKEPIADDSKRYLISSYFNGPGASKNEVRRDPANDQNTTALNYQQQSLVPLRYSSHSAEDVALYATGPYSNIFYGSHDNTFVGHATMFSLCLGPYTNETHCSRLGKNAFNLKIDIYLNLVLLCLFIYSIKVIN